MPCFLTVCVRAYFWKIAEFTFPFYQRTAYSGVVYQCRLGSVFLDVAVIRHDRTILRDNVCFPKIKTKGRSIFFPIPPGG